MLSGVVIGCSVSWWARLHFVAGGIIESSAMTCKVGTELIPRKKTLQIDRICSARVNCAMASARSLCVYVRHNFKRLQRLLVLFGLAWFAHDKHFQGSAGRQQKVQESGLCGQVWWCVGCKGRVAMRGRESRQPNVSPASLPKVTSE
jgi:hypothetical protein